MPWGKRSACPRLPPLNTQEIHSPILHLWIRLADEIESTEAFLTALDDDQVDKANRLIPKAEAPEWGTRSFAKEWRDRRPCHYRFRSRHNSRRFNGNRHHSSGGGLRPVSSISDRPWHDGLGTMITAKATTPLRRIHPTKDPLRSPFTSAPLRA